MQAKLIAGYVAFIAAVTGGVLVLSGNACGCVPAPENQTPPVVTGTVGAGPAAVGSVLSTTKGTWVTTGSQAQFPITRYAYRWQACDATGAGVTNCSNIAGATSATYTFQASDAGRTLGSVVTATNEGGSTDAPSIPASAGTTSSTTTSSTTTTTTTTPSPPPGGTLSETVVGASNTVCTKYASPSGSDSGAGTLASPYATIQKLNDTLTAGQVGCARAGTYGSTSTTTTFGNTAGVTITAYPGEAATLKGYPLVTGSGLTISYLNLDLDKLRTDGFNHLCAGDTVSDNAFQFDGTSNVIVAHNNIYENDVAVQYRSVAVGAGWSTNNANLTFRYNRIHDAGHCGEEDHGIYANKDTGMQIYGNWIYNIPAGTGMQLYASASPGPSNSHIYGNVMDQVSSCFDVGGNDATTTGNLLEHNICVNTVGWVVGGGYLCSAGRCTGPNPGELNFDYWGGGVGGGNVLQNNNMFCSPGFNCTTADHSSGVTVTGTTFTDPQFADPNYKTSHDYRLKSTSPDAGWAGIWNGL